MAIDFQVVYPQEAVKLTSVKLEKGGGIYAVDVTGEDFRSVDEVFINEKLSPDVIVVNRNRLLAQLPDSLQDAPQVDTVMVLSRRLMVTDRSILRFRITDTPGRVRGLLRLIQVFLKLLFTTPGSDIFSPKSGGGALKKIGDTYGKDGGGSIVNDFVISTTQTARQITARQGRDPSIPLDERLLSARVVRATFDKTQGALFVGIDFRNQAGQSAVVNAEL